MYIHYHAVERWSAAYSKAPNLQHLIGWKSCDMNKLSHVIQSISPVQQSSSQSSPVIRYDRYGIASAHSVRHGTTTGNRIKQLTSLSCFQNDKLGSLGKRLARILMYLSFLVSPTKFLHSRQWSVHMELNMLILHLTNHASSVSALSAVRGCLLQCFSQPSLSDMFFSFYFENCSYHDIVALCTIGLDVCNLHIPRKHFDTCVIM